MNEGGTAKTLVLIPARMASTRLPGKPLADIAGLPMIVQVAKRAQEAAVGRIIVAVDDSRVFDAVEAAGFEVVMTRADHQSGSDRIFEALTKVDPEGQAEIVINVQGDLPTIDPQTIRAALRPLEDPAVDIATLTVEIEDEQEKTNPNVVKIVGSPLSVDSGFGRSTLPAPRRRTGQWSALSPYRALCLSTPRARTLRVAIAVDA